MVIFVLKNTILAYEADEIPICHCASIHYREMACVKIQKILEISATSSSSFNLHWLSVFGLIIVRFTHTQKGTI